MTEPTLEQLQKRMEEYGFTEREARVSLLLDKAEELLDELTRESIAESGIPDLVNVVWRETHTREHFRALRRELAARVLHRDYPRGWGYIPPADDEEEAQESSP